MSAMNVTDESSATAGPTVKRADARRNREAILDAAKVAFARNGVETSLDQLARTAGVGPGTLYRHFPTREHLLSEVLYEKQAALLARRDEALAMPRAGDALRMWMAALGDYLGAFDGLPQPFIAAFEAQASPLSVTCQRLIVITGEFLAPAQAAGAARQSVTAAALFLGALGTAFVQGKAPDYDTTLERVADILTFGYLAGDSAADSHDPFQETGAIHD